MFDVAAANNKFANWTKIVLLYCDGSLFQGNNRKPVSVAGSSIYFRGAVNMRSHFKWADKKFNFTKAEQIVLSGESAGGIATYLWIDYLKSIVKDPKKVYGVVDSGIFLGPSSLVQYKISMYQLSQLFIPSAPPAPPTSTAPPSSSGPIVIN